MKISLLATNYLKALDIDLKLNNNDSKNVSRVMKSIASTIEDYSSDLGLAVEKSADRKIYISDDADIERIDLQDWQDRKKLSNRIRLDQTEAIYVLMDQNDGILSTITDGVVITGSQKDIFTFVSKASYALIIKREDLVKSKETREKRLEVGISSVELQKVKKRNRLWDRFYNVYKMFSDKKDQYYEILETLNLETIDAPEEKSFNVEKRKVREIPVETIFFNTAYPDENSPAYMFTEKTLLEDQNLYQIKYVIINIKTGQRGEEDSGNISGSNEFYIYLPQKQSSKTESSQREVEIEQFVPEIDFKKLIKVDATFPANLFPDYKKSVLRDVVIAIKDTWEKMIQILNELDVKNANISNILEKYERSIQAGRKVSSDLSYIDKSGYKVNLGKYFDKLASLPPSVPQNVKKTYENIFNYLTEETKKIVEYIKLAAEQNNFGLVSDLSYAAKTYGPKAFNNDFKSFLNEDVWNRNSSDYIKPNEAIEKMNIFKKYLYEHIDEDAITNLIS